MPQWSTNANIYQQLNQPGTASYLAIIQGDGQNMDGFYGWTLDNTDWSTSVPLLFFCGFLCINGSVYRIFKISH